MVMGASIIAVGLLVAACGGSSSTSTSTSTSRPSPSSTTAESTVPSSVAPAPRQVDPGPAPSTREQLAALRIDDRPSPQGRYDRGAWPHWDDIEGNGCDARQDALIAWSVVPATVDRTRGCRVITGSWISPYDGVTTSVPGTFDVDHLVPLENAFNSGGWQWDSTRRRAFANDPRELVVTSASSNRSKGSDPPDAWRPANRDAWCAYATGWVAIKVTWGLTATTEERDALGQMLDTCGPAGAVWPGVGAAVAGGGTPAGSTDAPPPTPDGGGTGGGSGGGEVYYANCSAARAAGAAPIRRGDPGYRSALDGDKDGVACE